MPHQCTNCGKVFEDGSKEMLSGCPNCGGNKFQFRPPGSGDASDAGEPESTDAPGGGRSPDATARGQSTPSHEATPSREADPGNATPDARSSRTASTADANTAEDAEEADSGGVRSRVSDWVRSRSGDADTESSTKRRRSRERTEDDEDREDTAQASARSDVVSRDELAAATNDVASEDDRPGPDGDGDVIEPDTDERPDLEELRAELNQQFESIKIVSPGKYELNLMELYDREEYIISLREDGRYVIEVPDTWRDDQ